MTRMLILFVILLCFDPSHGKTPSSEIDALKDLYSSTNGDGWAKSSHWLKDDPCDSGWFGITCIPEGKATHVMEINLANNSLTGTISDSIGDFPLLQFLYLNGNQIEGSLPDAIYDLGNLTILNLGLNKLEGSISSSIGKMKKLQILLLQLNYLTGDLPDELYNLTKMTELMLSNNKQTTSPGHTKGGLTGSISPNIANLKALTVFHINNNKLSGSIPSSLYELTSLKELYLGTNGLEGTISTSIKNLKKLTQLEIQGTSLSGSIPDEVWGLTKLNFLYLGLNKLTGTISSKLSNLKQLQDLSLQGSPLPHSTGYFSGPFPEEVYSLSNLRNLLLSHNKFTGTLSSDISKLSSLVQLDVGNNLLNGTIPSSLFTLRQLQLLYLHDNDFVGYLSSDISHFKNLLFFDASTNPFLSGFVPSYFTSSHSFSSTCLKSIPFYCPLPANSDNWGAKCSSLEIESITPPYADQSDTTTLQITGGFFAYSKKDFEVVFTVQGGVNANQTTTIVPSKLSLDGKSMTLTLPKFVAGTASVDFFFQDVKVNSEPSEFIVYTTPKVKSVSPSSGRQQGRTTVIVFGQNFAQTDTFGMLKCRFGNQTVDATFINYTAVSCVTPEEEPGNVRVSVTNDGKQFSQSTAKYNFFPFCDGFPVCSGRGLCNSNTTPPLCICESHFTNATCGACKRGYFGPDCQTCPSCEPHGTCQDGVRENGSCNCDLGWIGSTCTIPLHIIGAISAGVILAIVLTGLIIKRRAKRLRELKKLKTKDIYVSTFTSRSPEEEGVVGDIGVAHLVDDLAGEEPGEEESTETTPLVNS